jgi:hypothetical protein
MSINGANDVRMSVGHMQTTLDAQPQDWQSLVPLARGLITFMDANILPDDEYGIDDIVAMITTIQKVAFAEQDAGGIADLANWCLRQGVDVLQKRPDNVVVLQRRYYRSSYPSES